MNVAVLIALILAAAIMFGWFGGDKFSGGGR